MKHTLLFCILVIAGIIPMLGFGCSKSDTPSPSKPSGDTETAAKSAGAATPKELVANLAAAISKKDANAAIACFSKQYTAKSVSYIRENAKDNPEKLKAQGLSPEDLKLSDEAFLAKLLNKNFETGFESTAAAAELTVLREIPEGDKTAVYVRDKSGKTLEIIAVKESGAWKIDDQNYKAFKQFEPVQVLEAIKSAQEKYKQAHGNFGMLRNLKEEGLLDPAMLERKAAGEYEFSEEVPTADTWKASALPHRIDEDGEYMIDQTGKIRIKLPGKEEFENLEK